MTTLTVDIRLDVSATLEKAILALVVAFGRPIGDRAPETREPEPGPERVAESPSPSPAPHPAPPAIGDTGPETRGKGEGQLPRGARWTAERLAIIARDYPAGVPVGEIVAACNALPGLPVSARLLGVAAAQRGFRRPLKAGPAAGPTPPPTPSAPLGPQMSLAPVPASPPSPSPEPRQAAAGPQIADDATIRRWAAERGLCNGADALDLNRVNVRRVHLGLPPFERAAPARVAR